MTEPQRKLDEYGPEEMAIPEWKMIQKVGGDIAKEQGAEPGDFYNIITDEVTKELSIVVVDILMGRARWGEEITNAGPECASMDARSNQSIYGDDCSKCEFRLDAPWTTDAKERRAKCCLNYTILGIDLDHDYLPCMVRAHGISALPARQLITQLKMNRALKGEYFKARVSIKSLAKDTRYGVAFAIHPKIVELIADESKVKELKAESNRLLGTPIALPEGRPDEERPLGFTTNGTAFYSEEEKERLLAEGAVPEKPKAEKKAAPVTKVEKPAAAPAAKAEAPKKEEKEEKPTKTPDLDF